MIHLHPFVGFQNKTLQAELINTSLRLLKYSAFTLSSFEAKRLHFQLKSPLAQFKPTAETWWWFKEANMLESETYKHQHVTDLWTLIYLKKAKHSLKECISGVGWYASLQGPLCLFPFFNKCVCRRHQSTPQQVWQLLAEQIRRSVSIFPSSVSPQKPSEVMQQQTV